MPSINGVRILDSIESGTTNSAALQTLLGTASNVGAWQSLLASQPHVERILESDAAWTSTRDSNLALQTLTNSKNGFAGLFNNKTRLSNLLSNRTRMQYAMSNAPYMNQNYTTNASWVGKNTGFGSSAAVRDIVGVFIAGTGIFYTIVGDFGKIATSPDGNTWTQRNSGFGDSNIDAIAYGNSLYVIAGDDGKISTSTDSITWTARTSNFGTSVIRAVVYANSLWVAVGNDGKISTSTDGTTWTARTSQFGTSNIASVAYGNGTWVAVGDEGKISTSTDGTTWTARTSNVTSNLNAVIYGDKFFAVGDNGVNLYSSAGTSWSSGGTTSNSYKLVGASYKFGYYYACGVAGTNTAVWYTNTTFPSWSSPGSFSSIIGCNFKLVSGTQIICGTSGNLSFEGKQIDYTENIGIINGTGGTNLQCVAYGNGKWLFSVGANAAGLWVFNNSPPVGGSSTQYFNGNPIYTIEYLNNTLFLAGGSNGFLRTSTDASTWNSRTTNTSQNIFGMAYGNGKYVIVGSGGMANTSTDGITWGTPVTVVSGDTSLNSLAFGNGIFVATRSTSTNQIVTSTDGVTWNAVTLSGFSGNGAGTVFFGNGLFVVGGSSNGYIATSTNGTSWTATQPVTGGFFAYGRIGAYADGVYMLPNTNQGGISYSTDGVTWTTETISTDYNRPTALAVGQGYVIGAGKYSSEQNWASVMRIYDFVNSGWIARSTGFSTSNVQRLEFGNSLYVAVGNNGRLSTSTDLTTWVPRDSAFGSSYINDVTYANSLWVAVGQSGKISTSTDGLTWTARTSGTTETLNSVAYGNGIWVAVGNNGALTTSINGTTWTARLNSFGLSGSAYEVVFANNLFVVGCDSALITTSPDGITWTPVTNGAGGNVRSVAYGNGLFVSGTSTGQISTSSDGVSWTVQTIYPLGSSTVSSIVYGNGLWMAVGGGTKVATSTDGLSWRSSDIVSTNSIPSVNSVNYANGNFIICAGNGLYLNY
jgi:photosystem II stability/assembly factor-like uncharacterized protein